MHRVIHKASPCLVVAVVSPLGSADEPVDGSWSEAAGAHPAGPGTSWPSAGLAAELRGDTTVASSAGLDCRTMDPCTVQPHIKRACTHAALLTGSASALSKRSLPAVMQQLQIQEFGPDPCTKHLLALVLGKDTQAHADAEGVHTCCYAYWQCCCSVLALLASSTSCTASWRCCHAAQGQRQRMYCRLAKVACGENLTDEAVVGGKLCSLHELANVWVHLESLTFALPWLWPPWLCTRDA